jgi:hypothetical protein
MGKILAVALAVLFAVIAPLVWAQDEAVYEPFSADQLDNLLAPIALYPDPLLAQVLVAATFPDQIDEAARFVRDDPNADDVDGQPWDVSVKAVAHYSTVLDMMADDLDWTTALGQAYANQSTDVMTSIQRLRGQARDAGNLVSTSELQVVDSDGEIEVWPAQPDELYVPQYDPAVVFFYHRAPLFFGAPFFIGAWLNHDFDWRGHRVFYHGWENGGGWIGRSRPYVHLTNVYVNDTYRNVVINRTVVNRTVNYRTLNRYAAVYRHVTFNGVPGDTRTTTSTPYGSNAGVVSTTTTVNNKIINRNINTGDPRINEFRGHLPRPPQTFEHPNAGFTPGNRSFDERAASRRGQTSRALMPPPPPPPPPPAHNNGNAGRRH